MLFSRTCAVVLALGVVWTGTTPSAFAHHSGYVPSASGDDRDHEGISSAPMVNSSTASTLGRRRVTAGFAFDARRYNAIPAEEAHELHDAGRDIHGKNHEETYNLHAGYGLTDDLDLYVIAPLVSKTSLQIEDHDHLGRGERAAGFGDLRLLGKYRFWKEGVDAAVLVGVKAPTGETSDRDQSGGKFEAEQQPGSGSWDGEFGLAVSRSFRRRLSLATSVQYTLKGEGAQDRKLGDVFRYNAGLSYALRQLGQHPNLSLVLEVNTEWALRDHSRDERHVLDSGGTTVLISPGLTAQMTEHVSAFWSMPVPVYQNLGGEHEELQYEILSGVTWSF